MRKVISSFLVLLVLLPSYVIAEKHWYAIGYIYKNNPYYTGAYAKLQVPNKDLYIAPNDYFTLNDLWIVYYLDDSSKGCDGAWWIEAGIEKGKSATGDTQGKYMTFYRYCLPDSNGNVIEGASFISEVAKGTWHTMKIYEPDYTWIIEIDGSVVEFVSSSLGKMTYIVAGGEVATQDTNNPQTEMYAYVDYAKYRDPYGNWYYWSGTLRYRDYPYELVKYSDIEFLGYGP